MTSTETDKIDPVNTADKDPMKVLGTRQPEWVHRAYDAIASRRMRATGKPSSKADVMAEAIHEKLEREGIRDPQQVPTSPAA